MQVMQKSVHPDLLWKPCKFWDKLKNEEVDYKSDEPIGS